jgi:Heavy metal associated domain 2
MSHYLHHVPGRLRLKTRSLKNSSAKAAEVQTLFKQLPGIEAIELNLLTGSMLVRYDAARITSAQILGFLVANSVITSIPEARPRPAAKLLDGSMRASIAENLAQRVARSLADFVLEKVLQRAALALISAVV